jgi:hypothetical protein
MAGGEDVPRPLLVGIGVQLIWWWEHLFYRIHFAASLLWYTSEPVSPPGQQVNPAGTA